MKKIAGRYQITSKLGEGGMGVVYRAYDPAPMDREVAVKTLHELTDSFARELFYKECGALKSISHPNIVEIFDIGEFDDGGHKRPFFVMPLLPGQTLDELIRKASHRLTVERVVEIISQTCRGLQAAHERGLIHRDLKPSNIFVMADDSVKLIDFGVAHTIDANTGSAGVEKGTLVYMAPEQVQHKPVSVQSDIYSLGVTAYEALTRRQAFRGATYEAVIQAILTHIPAPASDLNSSVSQVISRVVHKAMAKQPWNRYDTAREFGETLQKASRNEPIAMFDSSRTQPRIQTASKALEKGDYQFASEIVNELEAEGNIDPQITLLRTQIDQMARQKTIAQLLDSARARFEESEDPLALQKLQEVLMLDPGNVTALGLRSKIEERRSDRQIDKWMQLARQHVDNHSYGHAREALQNALLLRPKDSRATRLLKDIEGEEQEYVRLREEKTNIYQVAVNAWKNGEVSQALSQMRLVLELDRRAPDASSPDAAGMYQSFYNTVRSEHEAINNGHAEARRHLAEKEFARALDSCRQFLVRYPDHALFRALKFDIEEQQRQQLSSFIAEIDRRLDAEPDLEAKVNLLREAVNDYPEEGHFARLLKLFESKRELVNSIVERARIHEDSGLISEALSDLETLQTIHGVYPGLKFEKERLQKRLEQHTRDAEKARWIRQIDQQLDTGDFPRAVALLDRARNEFPEDAELGELYKLALQGIERTAQAERLAADGQRLCDEGQFEQGVELLSTSLQFDDRPTARLALCDVFVARGQSRLTDDWRAAEALADRALELDPGYTPARNLRAQALDKKREELVDQCALQARRLQAAGNLDAAMAEAQRGLAIYPADPRLRAIQEALAKDLDRTRTRIDEGDVTARRDASVASTAQPVGTRGTAPTAAAETRMSEMPAPALDDQDLVVTRAVGAYATPPPPAVSVHPRQADHRTPPSSPSGGPRGRQRPASRPLVWGAVAATALAAVVAVVLLRPDQGASDESAAENDPLAEGATLPQQLAPAVETAAASGATTLATLTIRQMAPGTTVSIDDTLIGTVGADGSLSSAGVSPGRHTLQFSRPGYETRTVARDFSAATTLVVSGADVAFRAVPMVIEFLAEESTDVTISQQEQTLHRFTGPAKVPLAEGSYQVLARGPAGFPASETISVKAGDSATVDLRNVASGMERFDGAGWTQRDTWFTRRGGGFVLYNRMSPASRVAFTVRPDRSRNPFSRGPRFKWVVGFVDARNYVLVELDDESFYRTEVVSGIRRELPRVAHKVQSSAEVLHVSVEVSGTQVVHQVNGGSGWIVLDSWSRTRPTEGQFGFYVPGSETMEVSNFRFDAIGAR